jgi:hypothetical protein
MGGILIWLSGASPRILKRCPTELPKYLGIGSAILTTAVIAAISMMFALYTDVGAHLIIAAVLAIIWGLALVLLDRWFIVSLDRQSNPWRYLILAIPRMVLGILFGIVISAPLVLQIFHADIDNQVAIIHEARITQYYSGPTYRLLSAQAASAKDNIIKLQSVINSRGAAAINPSDDPEIASWVSQRVQAQKLAQTAYNNLQCQLYGRAPGENCAVGDGPLAKADQQEYEYYVAQVNSLNSNIKSRENALAAVNIADQKQRYGQAVQELPSAQARLGAAQSAQSTTSQSFVTSNAMDNGILIQLLALNELTDNNGSASAVRFLLYALFTVIQLLPILVKVLLNLGPQNTYEKMVGIEEEALLRAAREDALRRHASRTLE